MSWTLDEQETIVNATRADEVVRIYSAIPAHIRRLKKRENVTLVRSWSEDGHEVCEFTVASGKWNPVTGVKRNRVMTDEQKAAAAERLRKAREGRLEHGV